MTVIPNLDYSLVELEALLVSTYRPYFLTMLRFDNESPPYVHIVICCKAFEKLKTNERINQIFSLIKQSEIDIIDKVTLIVEAFTAKEMEDYLEYG